MTTFDQLDEACGEARTALDEMRGIITDAKLKRGEWLRLTELISEVAEGLDTMYAHGETLFCEGDVYDKFEDMSFKTWDTIRKAVTWDDAVKHEQWEMGLINSIDEWTIDDQWDGKPVREVRV